jgi:hypothetical protein
MKGAGLIGLNDLSVHGEIFCFLKVKVMLVTILLFCTNFYSWLSFLHKHSFYPSRYIIEAELANPAGFSYRGKAYFAEFYPETKTLEAVNDLKQ